MGRIVAQVEISNPLAEGQSIVCSMFVDTGAAAVMLPTAWKDRLGKFLHQESVDLVLANGGVITGEACGPAGIQIEGFRKIFNEVMFMEMDKENGDEYQPLLGYVALEQSQVAIDMLGHRLVPVQYVDCR
jgi:hypothetical protein